LPTSSEPKRAPPFALRPGADRLSLLARVAVPVVTTTDLILLSKDSQWVWARILGPR
jgi:hypothetical protein